MKITVCTSPLLGVSVTSQEWLILTARNWLQQFKFEDFSLYYINSLLLPKEYKNRRKSRSFFSFSPNPLLKQFFAPIIHLSSINSETKIFTAEGMCTWPSFTTLLHLLKDELSSERLKVQTVSVYHTWIVSMLLNNTKIHQWKLHIFLKSHLKGGECVCKGFKIHVFNPNALKKSCLISTLRKQHARKKKKKRVQHFKTEQRPECFIVWLNIGIVGADNAACLTQCL